MTRSVISTTIFGVLSILSLCAGSSGASMSVAPNQISPNGDGVRDELRLTIDATPGDYLTVRVYDSHGALMTTLAEGFQMDIARTELTWDGSGATGLVRNGIYTIKASFTGSQTAEVSVKVTVDTSHKWPPLKYTSKPFFPIGVWFQGSPEWGGFPADTVGAKAYFDRSFADLVAHGFNVVAVPNCPESLWETLLKSAQAKGIKVILEVQALVGMVSDEPITESQVYAAAKKAYDKIGKYSSLLRYQIRDEPWPSAVPNWLLVQRILGAVDPSRPAFSCFCSRDSMMSVSGSTILSEAVYDIYPLGPNAPAQTLGGFIPALDGFKEAARGYTQWPVLQSFAKPGAWRYPSAEELRAMTYLSLAAGAKGVFYFLYGTSTLQCPEMLLGLLDASGSPVPLYAPTSALAKELKQLSGLLLSLKPADWLPKVQGEARAGAFADAKGKQVLIVASTRCDAAITVRIGLGSDSSWKDVLSGEILTPADKTIDVPLAPGGGRVLVRQ